MLVLKNHLNIKLKNHYKYWVTYKGIDVAKDTTKYIFNSETYGKGRLALAIVRHYVASHSPSLSELQSKFPQNIQGNRGLLITQQDLENKNKDSKDSKKRYFEQPSESLTTADGVTVFVSSQWGVGNIVRMISKAKELHYAVDTLKGNFKSIDELYEEYKLKPFSDWIQTYKKLCDKLAEYKNKPVSVYDQDLLIEIWRTPDNGVAGVSPGFISHDEFTALLDDLPEITSKIVNNPSAETLKTTWDWAKKANKKGQFKTIKWGVINRVFATANPSSYSTVINETDLKNLVKKLNELFDLDIKLSNNWATQNKNFMDAIKAQGLEDEDVYLINTFAWKLFKTFGKKTIEAKTNESEPESKLVKKRLAENTIYYGPPGTGKTFKLQQLLKNKYTEISAVQERAIWLNEILDELSWFEVTTIILLDAEDEMSVSDIIEHEVFQQKLKLNERKTNIRQTAWAALQTHTIKESTTVKNEKRIEPLLFDKTLDSKWFIADKSNDTLEEYKAICLKLNLGPQTEEEIKRFEFVTFHQSYGYEEFIEGLRPITNAKGDISYKVKPGIFKRICKRAEEDPNHQYALVIDEINRGNISKIFGELISLIEVDKRKGCDHALSVTLPYSGLPFSVPPNVDIIGSMNTADRSLTHIDVALRRRFEFIELRTDYSLLSNDVEGINIKYLLYAMNQRIELLLDREHILGHALLMKVKTLAELKSAFKSSIMPLLEEYFFEDWGQINQVLNSNGFIEEQKDARSTWLGSVDEYAAKSYKVHFNSLNKTEKYQQIYKSVDAATFINCDAE
jgi:5-methylcytosine-specific restriction protein B